MRRGLVILVACAWLAGPAGAESSIALHNVTVIDGTGAPPQAGRTVIVRDGKIADIVAADVPLPDGLQVMDSSGRTLLPGLIDAHIHLWPTQEREAALRAMLESGVTTVRELATPHPAVSRDLARRAAAGEIESPAIHFAAVVFGPSFLEDPRMRSTMAPGQRAAPGLVVAGTDIAALVAERRETGATGLKVYAGLDGPAVAAIADEARRQGLKVWAHTVIFPAGPTEIIAARPDALIHTKGLIWTGRDDVPDSFAAGTGPAMAGFDHGDPDPDASPFTELLAAMVEHGIMLEPALMADGDLSSQPLAEHQRRVREWACRATGAAYRAGVTLGAGTDTPTRAGILSRELVRLVECGVSPLGAIRAATLNNAAALGIDATHGSIERGKVADLVIIDGDPLVDIAATATVRLVMQAGRVIRSPREAQATVD
jgi:predicted amidohydrolase YtcJ